MGRQQHGVSDGNRLCSSGRRRRARRQRPSRPRRQRHADPGRHAGPRPARREQRARQPDPGPGTGRRHLQRRGHPELGTRRGRQQRPSGLCLGRRWPARSLSPEPRQPARELGGGCDPGLGRVLRSARLVGRLRHRHRRTEPEPARSANRRLCPRLALGCLRLQQQRQPRHRAGTIAPDPALAGCPGSTAPAAITNPDWRQSGAFPRRCCR